MLLICYNALGKPHTGIDRSSVVIGTAVASSLGSFIVGVGGNLPFGLAPGETDSFILLMDLPLAASFIMKGCVQVSGWEPT